MDGGFIFSIRAKSVFVFLTVHAGFAMLAYGLYRSSTIWSASGAAVIYFGCFLGTLFLYLPFAPWLKRWQALGRWQDWIWSELPLLLSLIPLILALGKVARSAWAELKRAHGRGALDTEKFARIIAQVADEANGLMDSSKKPVKENSRKKSAKKAA